MPRVTRSRKCPTPPMLSWLSADELRLVALQLRSRDVHALSLSCKAAAAATRDLFAELPPPRLGALALSLWAARDDRLDVLAWLDRTRPGRWRRGICAAAALAGQTRSLDFALGRRFPTASASTWHFAAWRGHLEVLVCAHSHGVEWDATDVLSGALLSGEPAVVKWMRAAHPDSPWPCGAAYSLVYLTKYKDPGLLEWAHDKGGFVLDTHVCSSAASFNKLDIIMWTRGLNCPWDDSTCLQSIIMGHIELLTPLQRLESSRCLREHGHDGAGALQSAGARQSTARSQKKPAGPRAARCRRRRLGQRDTV